MGIFLVIFNAPSNYPYFFSEFNPVNYTLAVPIRISHIVLETRGRGGVQSKCPSSGRSRQGF